MVKNTTYLNITKPPQNQIIDLKEYPKLIRLNCANLRQVSSIINIPETLEELDCENNMCIEFDGLSLDLIKLNCSKNQIKKINNLPFGLKYLNCAYNKITHLEMLPEGLEILICGHNMLTMLEDLPIGLKKLNCEHNFITNIDCLPSTLTELVCSSNRIYKLTSLPDNLYLLDCAKNEIGDIIRLDKLVELEDVDLSNNKITGIGIDLSKCVKLKILNCSSNRITIIPTLPDNLQELHIHSNLLFQKISSLPVGLEVIGIEINLIDPNISLNHDLLILS